MVRTYLRYLHHFSPKMQFKLILEKPKKKIEKIWSKIAEIALMEKIEEFWSELEKLQHKIEGSILLCIFST